MSDADRRRLGAILASIALILEYAATPDWAHDQKTVDAIAKRLEDIGDQAGSLTEEALESMPTIPWRAIIGTRTRIAHDCGAFDTDITQRTIDADLPVLRRTIEQALGRD